MRIHFVTESKQQNWILRRLATCLAQEIPGATVGTKPLLDAGWNIFFNYALYSHTSTNTAAWFTHREAEGSKLAILFDHVAQSVNCCFCPSYMTHRLLPQHKAWVLPTFPTEAAYHRDLVLGVVGRGYKSGRKRMDWVPALREVSGVQVRVTGGKIPAKEMPAFYDGIDYLVVLASNEGGPQTVLEALARGCPVIAPNVGYAWEYPGLRYTDKDDLLRLLKRLVMPRAGWPGAAKVLLDALNGA